MRKQFKKGYYLFSKVISPVAIFFGFLFSVGGCSPSDPPSPQEYIEKDIPPINLGVRTMYVGTSHPCPNPGNGCIIPIPNYYIPPSQYNTRLNHLKTYYENDDLEGYFELYEDWEVLFPGLTYEHELVQKLVSEDLLLHFFDDTAFAVYDPKLTPYNTVYMFKMYP